MFGKALTKFGSHSTKAWSIQTCAVRKAAWHTLDDGGNPNDPRLQPLLEKIAKEETDRKLRQRALDLIAATRKVEEQKQALLAQKAHTFRGRCDWCGESKRSG